MDMEVIKKVIESRHISHFLIIGQIIDINLTLTYIIGDFKELSAKLSILKILAKLSNIIVIKKFIYRPPLTM